METNFDSNLLLNHMILVQCKNNTAQNPLYHYDEALICYSDTFAKLNSPLYKNRFLINLCEEPILFINERPYALRDKLNPHQSYKYICDIPINELEKLEAKLKAELVNASNSRKRITIYRDIKGQPQQKHIKIDSILTSKEYFTSHRIASYCRVPISSRGCGIDNGSIDKLIEIFTDNKDIKKFVINNCPSFTSSTMAYVIYRMISKNNYHAISPKNDFFFMNTFCVVRNLIQVVNNKTHQNEVECIFDTITPNMQFTNILHRVLAESNDSEIGFGAMILKRYCTLVIISLFLSLRPKRKTFKEFIYTNYEFTNFYKYVNKNKLFILTNKLNTVEQNRTEQTTEMPSNYIYVELGDSKSYRQIKIDGTLKKTLFVNLKEEPVFFIEDTAYALRERSRPYKNFNAFRMVKTEKIVEAEKQLLESLKDEIDASSKLVIHKFKNHKLEPLIITNIDLRSIKTQDQYFSQVHKYYYRFPVTSSRSFRFSTIDEYITFINKNKHLYGDILLHSNTHTGRSSFFCVITDIILKKHISIAHEEEIYHIDCFLSLVHLLEDGLKMYKTVCSIFEKYFAESFKVFLLKERESKTIIRIIKKFYILVCLHSYVNLRSPLHKSFEEWILARKDILILYNKINHYTTADFAESTILKDNNIKLQNGIVLNQHSILKNDYFIGSKFFTTFEHITGLQNLRIVKTAETLIVGLSMPTKKGIKNLKRHLNERYDLPTEDIIWICLREEPVIYIDKRPYVLRHCTDVNQNIEITGITVDKIETLESQLKADVEKHNEVCLFDEIDTNGNVETINMLVKYQKVHTAKDLFKRCYVKYKRVPVTDEQAPIPSIIDILCQTVKLNKCKAYIFNCQMGKGRTTTGMIIAFLTLKHSSCKGKKHQIKYKLVSILVKLLDNGEKSLSICDEAIDMFDHLENLRDVIDKIDVRQFYKKRRNFLLRYFYLICFNEFLIQNSHESFEVFLDKNPAIPNLAAQIDEVGIALVSNTQ